jgi:hypothetical protein
MGVATCARVLEQRKVMFLREVRGLSFPAIAQQVVNLKGRHPTRRTVENYYKTFSRTAGRQKTKYAKCGRKAWKLPKETQAFLIQRLKQLRRDTATHM